MCYIASPHDVYMICIQCTQRSRFAQKYDIMDYEWQMEVVGTTDNY